MDAGVWRHMLGVPRLIHPTFIYAARNASTIFMRDARAAGKNPPSTPIINENNKALIMIFGVSVNVNASSAKVCQFIVEMVKNCMKDAKKTPMPPPTNARKIDSIRNVAMMLERRNPSARMVPISPTRFATAAYMVIIAPIVAPSEKITLKVSPK